MSVKISVTGIAEFDKVLKGLPNKVNDKLLGNVHTIAANPLIQRAKLFAPINKGGLTKSIGSEKTTMGRSSSLGLVNIGPRRGRHKGQAGHLFEYGTKARYNKKGAYRGIISKKPFMQPSLLQTKNQVENIIIYQLSREIVSYIKQGVKI